MVPENNNKVKVPSPMRICWCGNTEFLPFNSDYGECRACRTLVFLKDMPPEQLLVLDDDNDYYGKHYWLEHQRNELGLADIYTRARTDLPERNLHWLKTLMKYCLPPAKVLELGCSHGSFVALMQQAGYDACGLEMSPWVVEFGKKTFEVPISVGPIEDQGIPTGSYDVIILMDVLEHLPNPNDTMAHCLKILKPDGLLLIQTPQFKEGINFSTLANTDDDFLKMLIPEEHIFLFSIQSVIKLFDQLGAPQIRFEPAIFGHYDMFFVVGREPLITHDQSEIETALSRTPNGRMALALLDLRQKELDLTKQLEILEADRMTRGKQIDLLTSIVKKLEAESKSRFKQIETLNEILQESEADRTARGEQIDLLTSMVKNFEAESESRFKQIETLNGILKDTEAERLAQYENNEKLSVIVNELKEDLLIQDKMIETLKRELRVLFSRPSFRILSKLAGSPEIKKNH